MSESLFIKWRTLGLVGKPQRQRKGPTGQELAIFSSEQRALFGKVAEHRVRGVSNQWLAAIPVFAWMTFGDDWVEIGQLRSALETACGFSNLSARQRSQPRRTQMSKRVAALTAKQTYESLPIASPSPKARAEFRTELTAQLQSGSVDTKALMPIFERLWKSTGFTGSLAGGLTLTPAGMIDGIASRLTAAAQLPSITDDQLLRARAHHQSSMAEYAALVPALAAASPERERYLWDDLDASTQAKNSVSNLLLLLGFELRTRKEAS